MILIVMAITSFIFRRRTRLRCQFFLEDYPFIPNSPRYSLAIKIFQQRDGVFAGDADQIFESSHINFGRLGLVLRHGLAEALKGAVVEDKVVREFYQNSI